MRIMLKAKIHHATVTNTKMKYIGSIYIDENLLNAVGINKYEKVEVINITNGHRWETYAMPKQKNSGEVSVRGGGARLCERGDTLIILAYEITDKDIYPTIAMLKNNKIKSLVGKKRN